MKLGVLVALGVVCVLAGTVYGDECSGSAEYDVKVDLSFTPAVDPLIPAPGRAQIPVLVAVVHSEDVVLFRLTQRLNDSVAEVASRGTAEDLQAQLEEMKGSGGVSSYEILTTREDDIPVEGSVSFRLQADGDTGSRLTVMVHLSPSPAWFAGLDAYALCREKTDGNGFAYLAAADNVTLGNFNAGLDKGQSFEADPDPYAEGSTVPVAVVDSLDDDRLAALSLRLRERTMTWWKILVGVLVAVIVIVVVSVFVVPRIWRRKATEDIPLTSSNVEW